MKRLAILGSGDLGQQIAHHAICTNEFSIVGFFDDYADQKNHDRPYPILGKTESIVTQYKAGIFDELMIGIGYKHMLKRRELFEQFENTIPFATIIHPTTILDKTCKIGKGSIVYPGCILDMGTVVAENCLINVGCTIAHDSKIGAHSFLSPSVNIAGFVQIDHSNAIGIGTTIIDNIKIIDSCQLGGGAVVTKNIIKRGLYVGIPAKFIKEQ